jgi:hypothetical protein
MARTKSSAISAPSHKEATMSHSSKHIPSVTAAASAFGAKSCFLALLMIGLASSALARDVKVPEPIFNSAAARDFPQAIYNKITAKITYETTFEQFSPSGLIRWWTRTIKLVDFVRAPSPTYEDTYLYAMRYVVSVISDKDSLAIYGTSCQVVVVYKNKQFDEPTVVCEPVNLDQPDHQS